MPGRGWILTPSADRADAAFRLERSYDSVIETNMLLETGYELKVLVQKYNVTVTHRHLILVVLRTHAVTLKSAYILSFD